MAAGEAGGKAWGAFGLTGKKGGKKPGRAGGRRGRDCEAEG